MIVNRFPLVSHLKWFWGPDTTNLADYYANHHYPAHHNNVGTDFFTPRNFYIEALRRRLGKLPPIFSASKRVC